MFIMNININMQHLPKNGALGSPNLHQNGKKNVDRPQIYINRLLSHSILHKSQNNT